MATANPACKRLPSWDWAPTPPPTASNGLPTPCSTPWMRKPERNYGTAEMRSSHSLTSPDSPSPMDVCTSGPLTARFTPSAYPRSEEHTSELQSHSDLVCRLL